jgi:hypothetical protein
MPVYNGFDTESRERIYDETENNFESNREFGKEVFRTAVGQEFLNTFGSDDATPGILLGAAHKLNPNARYITTGMVLSALKILMTKANCPFKRKAPEAEPVVEEAPQPIHRGQQMWREHAEFMEHGGKDGGIPSGDEVRSHMRESKSFRSFITQGYQARMANDIGGAGAVLNAPVASSDKKPTPELLEWVEWYRRTAVEDVRKKLRADCNPSGFEHENRMFRAACECGLI